jgi:V/A-type H+-transporting ATPase subunit E
MEDSIETFVAKLQEEGVQAGQAAADRIRAEAKADAEQIIAEAKAQAEQIVAEAEANAKNVLERSKTDLQLAARDTVARLRDTLTDCLNAIIAEGAHATLVDLNFLGKTLHEIVMLYAKADLEHKLHIDINVPGEIHSGLKEWAFRELAEKAVAQIRPSLDLHGRLRQVGFEYTVEGGGTVEVTVDSVVELLSGMVAPALREVLAQAAAKRKS